MASDTVLLPEVTFSTILLKTESLVPGSGSGNANAVNTAARNVPKYGSLGAEAPPSLRGVGSPRLF